MNIYDVGATLPGGYHVIDVLRGGMGVVYICHQRTPGKDYAIKTPQNEKVAGSSEFRRLFEQEVRTWINISDRSRCPKIVTAHSFDEENALLILEYVDGLSVNQLARARHPVRPIHPRHFLRWARDVAEAMREMHGRFGVVHRDLKPHNILVSTELVAKVTDLGISKAVQTDPRTATLVGTPAYMAPEILRGEVSYRSDIYSYGATLFWMLTCEHAAPLDAALERPLPGGVKRLVERCLQVDPSKRPGSFEEVLEELEGLEEAALPWEANHYHFCERHGFYSPMPPPEWRADRAGTTAVELGALEPGEGQRAEWIGCLLCEHRRYIEGLRRSALTLVERRAATRAAAATAIVPPGSPLVEPTQLTAWEFPSSSAKNERPLPGSPTAQRRWPRRAAIGAAIGAVLGVAALGAVVIGWLLGDGSRPGSSGDPGTSGTGPAATAPPGTGPAGTGSPTGESLDPPPTCGRPGCDEPSAPPLASIKDWTPAYCRTHSPVICKGCGRRYTEEDDKWGNAEARCDNDTCLMVGAFELDPVANVPTETGESKQASSP